MTQLPAELNDPAWLHGLSAFTTVRTQRGRPLLWREHLARLADTCAFLELPDPRDAAEPVTAQLQPLPEGRLRLTVTAHGLRWSHAPLAPAPREAVTLWLSELQVHPQLAQHKTGNYLPYVLAAREAARHGAFEGALRDAEGHVVDGSRSSLLLQVNGELLVPQGGLPSVTRACLLQEWGRPAREVLAGPSLFAQAEHVWLIGSGLGVLPVTTVRGVHGEVACAVAWLDLPHPALRPPR